MLYHLDLPRLTCLHLDKNGCKMLMKPWFDTPQGMFLFKSETKFQTPDKKALIWDPVLVSMIKNSAHNKAKRNQSHDSNIFPFCQLQTAFTCILLL